MANQFEKDLNSIGNYGEEIANMVLLERSLYRDIKWHNQYEAEEEDRQFQDNGSDFTVLTKRGTEQNIDVKSIAGWLPTFSFEIKNMSSGNKGWFHPESNKIKDKYCLTSIVFPDSSAYKDNKENLDKLTADKIELLFTDGKKLFNYISNEYIEKYGLTFKEACDNAENTLKENNYWDTKDKMYIDRTGTKMVSASESRSIKDGGPYFVCSNNLVEKPLNLVIPKRYIKEEAKAIDKEFQLSKDHLRELVKEYNLDYGIVRDIEHKQSAYNKFVMENPKYIYNWAKDIVQGHQTYTHLDEVFEELCTNIVDSKYEALQEEGTYEEVIEWVTDRLGKTEEETYDNWLYWTIKNSEEPFREMLEINDPEVSKALQEIFNDIRKEADEQHKDFIEYVYDLKAQEFPPFWNAESASKFIMEVYPDAPIDELRNEYLFFDEYCDKQHKKGLEI